MSPRRMIFSLPDDMTMEDLLETLLGTEIVDETDRVVGFQEAARKHKSNCKTGQKGEDL
jgi:hypothetical protein